MPRTPNSTPHPSNRHQTSDPTPTLSPTHSAVPTPDSISQHAPGLELPLPMRSRNRTPFPQLARGDGLSPGKGPCSCCKFPKIFWLSRWMRRVTTWGRGGGRSSKTRGATVRVLPGRLGPRYLGPTPKSPALTRGSLPPPCSLGLPPRPAPLLGPASSSPAPHQDASPHSLEPHLRVSPFDVAQRALREFGQLRVAHRVHCRGTRLPCQRLHLGGPRL